MSVQEITKFKNGKLAFRVDKNYGWYIDHDNNKLNEEYYHDIVNMSDIYFNQINGYMYLTDFNTGFVYELESQNIQNPLKWLLDSIYDKHLEGKAYYLYPLSKREGKELMHQLELDY